jgi:hypothetical protein
MASYSVERPSRLYELYSSDPQATGCNVLAWTTRQLQHREACRCRRSVLLRRLVPILHAQSADKPGAAT